MWRGATAPCRYAAINYEDSICHASDSASPPCTTFSSPGLTGRRQRSAFLVRNPARCLRRYWNRWSWHPRRSVHLEKHSVADPVIDANFGILGTGSDTGQSTRSPASATNLVGIRPTRGLVSRSGILPISSTQDEAGPLTRSVADAARMLAVMAGYDPDDPITAFGQRQQPHSYVSSLDRDGLRGARIGLLTDLMGTEALHEEVNGAVHTAVQLMEHLGATVLPIALPHLTVLTTDVAMGSFEFREAFNRYLARVGPDAPVTNLAEFLADGRCHPSIKSRLELYAAMEDGTQSVEYKSRWWKREALRQAVMTVLAHHDLDAVLYPHQKRLVAGIGEAQLER